VPTAKDQTYLQLAESRDIMRQPASKEVPGSAELIQEASKRLLTEGRRDHPNPGASPVEGRRAMAAVRDERRSRRGKPGVAARLPERRREAGIAHLGRAEEDAARHRGTGEFEIGLQVQPHDLII
jgi:hypothetical protein